ncbi:formyltransferase family protein [Streptomyces sp. NPDC050508]|uniref:formyltransferase family protein n=1 Tax=Streptomyces sp. NPDC050508 TaxID=3155405 RepID=UPI0034192E30
MTDIRSVLGERDLLDGNVFSPDLLAALGEEEADLPMQTGSVGDSPPTGLFRLPTATAAVRATAANWLQKGNTHDERLLHEAETSMLLRPPVHERARAVDEELAALFLGVAHSWLSVAERERDPRYLNAALKLIGCAVLSGRAAARGREARSAVASALATLARTEAAIPSTLPPPSHSVPSRLSPRTEVSGDSRIVVLAGEGSRGLPLFLSAARTCGFTVHGVLHHASAPSGIPDSSDYLSAWYPLATAPAATAPPAETYAGLHQRHLPHGAWDVAVEQLAAWNTGLLVLLGMDVVPPHVLEVPTAATINAHNGELPAFRGMDAVAWARLAGQHPVCSVHRVTRNVDAGNVLASAIVAAGSPDLRAAVKACQIRLLADLAADYAATGNLPVGKSQDETDARRWYRMHPALRRLLDRHHTDLTRPTNTYKEPSI